jgi:hypothetical protein
MTVSGGRITDAGKRCGNDYCRAVIGLAPTSFLGNAREDAGKRNVSLRRRLSAASQPGDQLARELRRRHLLAAAGILARPQR